MNKIAIATSVFVLVSIFTILGIVFQQSLLIVVFKPLIILSLLVLYGIQIKERSNLYISALIASFFGDVFLLFTGESYFILGLISFLIAHLFFIKIVYNQIKKPSKNTIFTSFIPFLMLLVLLLWFLKNSLGNLFIPVLIYGITIITFGTLSLINYRTSKSIKAFHLFIGALIFICSDSLLAINKFYLVSLVLNALVMITYVLAQFFIYKSEIIKTG